jgi:two-component sensor histidine kinase
MVTSLLSLQLRSIRADSARRAVADVQTRIRALALVHRHLYEGSDVAKVDIRLFMAELCQLVRDAAGPNADLVSLEVEAPPLVVPSDRAVPLALFVTEALTNSFKHAFPQGRPGRIRVSVEPGEDTSRVIIADDGIGIASPMTDAPVGLGLSLMRAFAKQVGGTIETSGPPGTVTTLVFRAGLLNERQEPPASQPAPDASTVFGQSTASERARNLKVIGGSRSTTSPSSATG